MISAVIFDFGNVICRFDNRIILQRISDRTGKSVAELQGIVHSSMNVVMDYEKGVTTSREFFLQISGLVGLNVSEDEFISLYTDKFTPLPGTFEVIRSLKGKYKLGLLSNTSEWDFQYGIRTTEIFPLFDAVTLSFQVHTLKPAKEIYFDMLDKLKEKAERCVYVDDLEENIIAARAIGMNAVHYRQGNNMREELHRYLG
jgi:glucose-1-phosphatase